MEKIILAVNEKNIEIEMAACENAQYLMQRLFGVLKEINCEPDTIKGLIDIQSQSDIEDYLKGQIIKKQEAEQPLEVLGMPVNKGKLKELIMIPNINQINSIKNDFDLETMNAFKFLQLNNGEVSLKEEYEEHITEKHTIYTKNERQIEIVNKLTILRDAMNDWMEYTNERSNNSLVAISGLRAGQLIQGRYSLDVNYILSR